MKALRTPDAVVDNPAELLDKVTIDLRRDGADGLAGEYVDTCLGLCRLGEEPGAAESDGGGGEGGGFEERASRGRMQ
jgi:hypothetical protein